ncbi:hypothetical protein BGZ74_010012 [Mortierella antarctica]|uniref:Checkpoint protein n=1 Tax=Podila minutissima TaxID=64525 RepID=A0A9P5SQV2_9FUNG|nr:hypothetical protein BGZ74_010012 [Mortierella antarctica]KAF9333852.1 hypothetical protein BG006_003056 [Podila minutissima]KAG0353172.1 hypothetical protein BG005_007493 [Podila minutissima]
MRLRAKLNRNLLFFKIAQAVEKIGKSVFIKFSPEFVAFGAIHSLGDSDQGSGGAIQCWSRVPVESVFIEYKVESTADNEIYVEMKTEDITLASKSSASATAIVMRMTGKSSEANMTFVITNEDHLGNSREITQNVPIIKILSAEGASNTSAFDEPMMPTPEVHIMLPPLEQLKHVTASYKSAADFIVISANLRGVMTLTTSDGVHQFNNGFPTNSNEGDEGNLVATRYGIAEKAELETRFSGLFNPSLSDQTLADENAEGGENEQEEHPHLERLRNRPHEMASVLVRGTDLQKVLQSSCIKPMNVVCS